MEPGESLEDAVAREVFEETGVRIDAIEYHSSQPWPFPSSLMLGFTAHALTQTIELRDDELEDARWFTRSEVAGGVPLLPPNQSISFSLIEHWFDAGRRTAGRRPVVAPDPRGRVLAAIAIGGGLPTLAFVLGAAFLAGFVDSIVGGGGLIQVPALLAGYPGIAPPELLGTNKLGSICGTGSAVYRYTRFVRIPWRSLVPAAGLAFFAALAGASLVNRVPAAVFRPLVPIMLVGVLAYVLYRKDLGAVHRPAVMSRRSTMLAAAGICAIGLYDGFFGPGTGSFLMLLFIRVHGFDFLHASAAARLVNVATNAGALVYFGVHADIHWTLGLCLGVCNASGSFAGIHAAHRRGAGFVRIVFIAVVAALIAKTAWDGFQ